MLALIVSAALVCAGAVLIGQLALRLCGAREWNWSAPAVGMAILLLFSMPALHVPGHASTTAVVLLALLLAGLVLMVREPAQRPPLSGMLAGAPVALLVLVPFISAGRAGTLGVGFNNDMSTHLILAHGFQTGVLAHISGSGEYPIGPHALAAALAQGLGAQLNLTFAGLTAAVPVLIGWTALGALRATGLLRRTALAILVGIPFFVAGYYGQGSFKELLEALFALAVVLLLSKPLLPGLWRWAPLGLLLAGTLSVYSAPGLAWPVVVIGVWLAVSLGIDIWRRGSLRHALGVARDNVLPLLAGVGVTVLVLVPQLPRLERFVSTRVTGANGTGIAVSDIGNLLGRIPLWPAFGVWDQPDYRAPAIDPFVNGMWTAFVLGLALVGVVWCLRRGDWLIPLSAIVFVLIWAFSDDTQSPYVAAKAILIASPLLLLLLAALPVVDIDAPGAASPRWWHIAAPLLAVVLVVKVGHSSWSALRISHVGPTAHSDELRSLKANVRGGNVLFLGHDDFIRSELSDVELSTLVLGNPTLPIRPEKPWALGKPIDFDSLPPELYNDYNWVIIPRDAAGSSAPEGLRLVRSTRTFDLYRRVGRVPSRSVLAEGDGAGAILRCDTKAGRALLRRGGVALVREPSIAVPVGLIGPGGAATTTLPLTPGTWDLELPYVSPRPLQVRAAGRRFDLPASLDRPGVRLPAGAISVTTKGPVPVTVSVTKNRFTPRSAVAEPVAIVATKRGTARVVPLREACGRYTDWYRSASSR